MTATHAGRACCIPASDSFRSIRRSEGVAEGGIGGGLRALSPRNGRPPPCPTADLRPPVRPLRDGIKPVVINHRDFASSRLRVNQTRQRNLTRSREAREGRRLSKTRNPARSPDMTATHAGRACCIPASDSFRSIRRSEGVAEGGIGGGLRALSPRNGRPPPCPTADLRPMVSEAGWVGTRPSAPLPDGPVAASHRFRVFGETK